MESTRFPAHPIVSQGSQEGCPMGWHPKYPKEFRRESVRLVLTRDKSMANANWEELADDARGRLMTTSQAKSPSAPEAIGDQLRSGGS